MADYKLLSAVLADYADKAGTADSATTADTATTAETATYATSAGSATSATTATTATKLSSGTVGSSSVPVYFSNGVPVEATGVSSGGASWTSSTWDASSNTTADILGGTTSKFFYAIFANGQDALLGGFTGIYFDQYSQTGPIFGTWYDYESATVVSGFWSETEFDDYMSELMSTSSDSNSYITIHYLA